MATAAVTTSWNNNASPVVINAPAERVLSFLQDVAHSGKCHPTVEEITRVADNVFRFRHQDRKVGTTHFNVIHVTQYRRNDNVVSWDDAKDHNPELCSVSNHGKFVVTPRSENVSQLTAEVTNTVRLPIPDNAIMMKFAQKLGEREMSSVWDTYTRSIKLSVEDPSGKIVHEEVPLDAPVKDEDFERRRLSHVARAEDYNAVINDYYHSILDIYRVHWGDHWHFGFFSEPDDTLLVANNRLEAMIAKTGKIDKNSRCLDVGCGLGGPTCYMAQITGARFTGLNICPEQVEIARKKAQDLGLADRVNFDVGDAMKMPYPDNTFDCVTFYESVCHMPSKLHFFREVYRVLKPGGRLCGTDWLQCHDPTAEEIVQYIEPICAHFAVCHMGSIALYQTWMEEAGFYVPIASDLQSECDLLRNWDMLDQKMVANFQKLPKDSIDAPMEMLMAGGIAISQAARNGAFVIGRFCAIKPPTAHQGRQWCVGPNRQVGLDRQASSLGDLEAMNPEAASNQTGPGAFACSLL